VCCSLAKSRAGRTSGAPVSGAAHVPHDAASFNKRKDEGKEVQSGQECGMAFENYQDMREGDIIECYRVEEVRRSL
jgi:translation initiation factor IF-2